MSDTIDPTEPAPWDLIRVAMVIGPVTGYFHQYYTMHKMKTSMGFSSVTCGVLIVSRFDVALLYQSILMTVVQLFLLELCVRFYPWTVQLPMPVTYSGPLTPPSSSRPSPSSNTSSTSNISNGHRYGDMATGELLSSNSPGPDHVMNRASRYHSQGWYKQQAYYWGTHFWNWPRVGPYYLFLAVFSLLVGLSLLIIGSTDFFVGLLGLAALGIEATVPLPQAIQNYRSKSTAGFSPAILLMWVVGDSFKTYYYISTHAKYQFVGCGIIQLCIDCVIIMQTVVYSKYYKDVRRRYSDPGDGFFGISQDHVGGVNGRSSSEALLADEDGSENHQGQHGY
ncbi:hypothetical protein BGZ54_007288 [Gamsiella multidivaricata]|nr:hypothetical protein BGZ54_007288 [Gamsiella multidivaricata]